MKRRFFIKILGTAAAASGVVPTAAVAKERLLADKEPPFPEGWTVEEGPEDPSPIFDTMGDAIAFHRHWWQPSTNTYDPKAPPIILLTDHFIAEYGQPLNWQRASWGPYHHGGVYYRSEFPPLINTHYNAKPVRLA